MLAIQNSYILFVSLSLGCAMTQGFLIVSFFVLSWKWYLFGAFLWAHYFWHRRKRQVTAGVSVIDVRHTGRNACQLGITLGAFAFILSAPTQWIYVASGFVAGGLIGWALTVYLTGKQRVQHSPKRTASMVVRQISWFVFAATSTLAIAAIAKLGNSALIAVLILWAAGAGYLVALGLYVSLVKPNRNQVLRNPAVPG